MKFKGRIHRTIQHEFSHLEIRMTGRARGKLYEYPNMTIVLRVPDTVRNGNKFHAGRKVSMELTLEGKL